MADETSAPPPPAPEPDAKEPEAPPAPVPPGGVGTAKSHRKRPVLKTLLSLSSRRRLLLRNVVVVEEPQRSGRIRVSRKVQDREVALCDLEAGQTFGELSIIEDGVASATLRAVADTEVLSISMHDLATFLRTSPNAAAKFWRAIAIDLRRRILQTNDVVRSYFEVNRALVENETFREAYAMCNR